ncbi:hypothetical protein [Treponema sp. Marseille-Q4132]|uniref:hypothetical protein n=1 Tax=Treponema sp. Marseille-Q4132 TaxID=2766701 RepID=UPI001652DAA2|nr:hypothetical protein [Treponema sp. Marseille-Q4132]QNL96541.1 hypothetical protein H9I35_08840 [Treponema sp. Marseille-Q4132]
MSRLDELKAKRSALSTERENTIAGVSEVPKELLRVADVAHNAEQNIKNLDEEFELQTKLRGKDIGFLFFATALQCVRQYILTDFKIRMDDQKAADKTLGKKKFDPHDLKARKEAGFEVRHHKLYNPTLEEIVLHPVPFDTTKGSKQFEDLNPFSGTGKLRHRAGAIGHDPILGWIFGTANIATSTLTGWNMQSFHISSKTGTGGGDFLKLHADTGKVLSYTFNKLLHENLKGKIIIGTSLVKEGVHLASDVNTKHSLPFPIVSTYDPKLASGLADYGIDMANILTVGKQVALASAINMLVVMIHRMTFNAERDGDPKLYEVRTRRVVTYSNVIASASNVLAVGIAAGIGIAAGNEELVRRSLRKLDIGGLLVTLYRLINDYKFISDLKQEFILNNFDKMVQGDM